MGNWILMLFIELENIREGGGGVVWYWIFRKIYMMSEFCVEIWGEGRNYIDGEVELMMMFFSRMNGMCKM